MFLRRNIGNVKSLVSNSPLNPNGWDYKDLGWKSLMAGTTSKVTGVLKRVKKDKLPG